MSEKVIIVKRKKKKVKPKPKPKPKAKPKPKSTMEQRQTQNIRVIINERATPRRNRPLAVKGYNTPRLSIQPPTIIHKGLDAENALNSFRNIYDTRIRALERGLNGINGNITNLTSQLQNNRPPPLHPPQPSGTIPVSSEMSDEERQAILDGNMAVRLQQEQQQQYTTLKKDFLNDQLGEQDQIFENYINVLPLAQAQNIELAKAQAERVSEEPSVSRAKKFTREQREQREMEGEERAQLRLESKGQRSLEYTEEKIRDADEQEVQSMILSLGEQEGDKYFDNFGGIKRGQLTQARNYVRNVVKQNREKRLLRQQQNIEGRKLPQSVFRNL